VGRQISLRMTALVGSGNVVSNVAC
jgi:hypothetical protein